MSEHDRERLRAIRTFPQLVTYLRDELNWPIETDDFEDLTFDYEPEELGIDAKTAAKIQEIKQLRPLVTNQPWGIFFVKFEPKRLPVVALRRILSRLVINKRASSRKADQPAWYLNDLLFISNYGDADGRQITFAHFSEDEETADLPTLRVLGWDDADTALHIDHAHRALKEKLCWPEGDEKIDDWRARWSSVFTLRHREVITTAKDLSERLAKLASDIRKRVNTILRLETEKGPLRRLHASFKEALIHDLSDDDFADMYAQTITYGLLTARVSRPNGLVAENITDMVPVTNPFLRDLLGTFLTVGGRKGKIDFDEVGISDVVQTLRDANMEAVLRDFGDRKPEEDPVIFFYEDFLKAYDAEKKVKRGVFYTPKPVVSYIVRSVHELLQTEFGLEDGLASTVTWAEMLKRHSKLNLPTIKVKKPTSADLVDEPIDPATPFVQILDPAVGTATFLVEVIDVIHKTMLAKWKKEGRLALELPKLWNDYVPNHLLPRLHGYELMMAPYAIAHMKIGLKLYETGYRFGSNERARIYLTNSLEPAQDFSDTFEQMAPALAHEAQAVNEIKGKHHFTVVIANPPYAQMSANLTESAVALVKPYRSLNGQQVVEKSALSLERNLNDDYIKFLRLAEQHLESCCGVLGYITNNTYLDAVTLRGLRWHLLTTFDSLRILNLHGDSDKRDVASDGSPDKNVFEIKKGVAITLQVRKAFGCESTGARDRKLDLYELRGNSESKLRWLAAHTASGTGWLSTTPREPTYLFVQQEERLANEYATGVSLSELMPENATGFTSGYDEVLTGFTVPEIVARLQEFATLPRPLAAARFNISGVFATRTFERRDLIKKDVDLRKRIQPFLFAPFDIRYAYYRPEMVMTASHRVGRNLLEGGNVALMAMRQVSIGSEFSHVFVTKYLPNNRAFYSTKGKVTYFPLFLLSQDGGLRLERHGPTANLNAGATTKLAEGLTSGRGILPAESVLEYCYAILHSCTYRRRYDSLLRSDYPRIPLPVNTSLGRHLIELGRELVALHLMDASKLDKPITNWKGSTPSTQVEKVSYADRIVWIDKAKTEGFRGVEEEVWQFHIGGYQVCEKWLKDRKGRQLSKEDITHYQKIVVALAETIKIMAQIDETIEAHGGWPIK